MKTLHRSLLSEILVSVFTCLAILTMLVVILNVFTRIFDLLINHDVPIRYVFEFIGLLIPWTLVYTLPWSLLTAILLVFGRQSADSELIAIRASGISLATYSAPILLLSVVFTMICLAINLYFAPWAHVRMKSLPYTLASESPMSLFTDDAVLSQFPGKRIYVGRKVSNEEVENLHVWELDSKQRPVRTFRAARAKVKPGDDGKSITLTLYDARMEERDPNDPLNFNLVQPGRRFAELPLKFPLEAMRRDTEKGFKDPSRTFDELLQNVWNVDAKTPPREWAPTLVEIQKRVAASMSCITFALIAIPLAIRSHRRETSVGIILSFVVVFAYYFLIITAETLKTRASAFPELLIWLPNLLFQVIGLFAFMRACRA